ncbi:helicase-related protein [Pueribacillus sp. YX66]|uniref:helicase-related protein n=1 Tax=Pueribacillus sp. YX66 TaxID=3229242 RepID=UPI00358D5228
MKNQIAFITEGKDDALQSVGIQNIGQTLRKAQLAFNQWLKQSEKMRTTESLLNMLNFDYFKLLDALTIARSRKHLEKYYDIKEIGSFPKRLKPSNQYEDIDRLNEFPSIQEVNKLINRLNLSAYSPLKYILPEKQHEYSKKYDRRLKGGSVFKQIDRERSLVHLMRVNLLKRMESSIYAFGMTIASLLKRIDHLLEQIKRFEQYGSPELNMNEMDVEDEDIENLVIGSKVKVLIQDVDRIKWKQDLEEDKEKLEKLLIEAYKVQPERDAKLSRLKTIISNKIKNPINDNNKKVIIFTAFADTAKYIYRELSEWIWSKYKLHSALITGSDKNETTLSESRKNLNAILTNFSPNSKEREETDPNITEEIDILIATDCISEGQNLQDCDYLINYDIHWNPVRIIQRFGRIDRLGSKNKVIQLVNFWPNMDLEEYINLESRVSGRMVLLDISATGEENVIDHDETKKMNDLEYRAKQLKKLQEEVVDLEDIAGGISITDLTLNDFKMDLIEYMNNDEHKEELESAPLGLHAIASLKKANQLEAKKGVIFCLKQRDENVKVRETSSIFPHYLIYLTMEGEILFGLAKTKQVLDLYRKLAYRQTELEHELILQFLQETKEMSHMTEYEDLFVSAVESIIGVVEEKGIESLFEFGKSTFIEDVNTSSDNFELVSFLVIK